MNTHRSIGEAMAAAMIGNSDRAAALAASRRDGMCGICGRDPSRPSAKLCPYHPGLETLDAGERAQLTAARSAAAATLADPMTTAEPTSVPDREAPPAPAPAHRGPSVPPADLHGDDPGPL